MTQPELSSNARAILDQVLEGESPEQRARVLRLVVELGINPEEEFFAIALALKHLQLIILEGPEYWKREYSDFLNELDSRVETGKQMLLAHTNNIEAISILANDVKEVRQSLMTLQTSTTSLDKQLSQVTLLLDNTINQWMQNVILFQEQLQIKVNSQSVLLKEIVAIHKEIKRRPPAFLFKASWNEILINVVALYSIVITCLWIGWII